MKLLYGGTRASKFRKRMKERLIDDTDVMILRKEIPHHHEDYNFVSLTFKYKGVVLREYPLVGKGLAGEYFSTHYGSTVLCALLLIDGYFARKHEVTLNIDGKSFFDELYKIDNARREKAFPRYWNRREMSGYFIQHVAEDLMWLLKFFDRRTGKRSLRKMLESEGIPNDLRAVIFERLR